MLLIRPVAAATRIAALFGCVALIAACDSARITVAGQAMRPSYNDGDRLIASKDVSTLSRGDVIGFRYPRDESKSFLQRIVGLPGERIEIVDGLTFIDGKSLVEPYVAAENRLPHTMAPVVLGPDEYFVMGDNRGNSSDSRSWGPVKRPAIWARMPNPPR